jgi:UDP-N-acetylglucosamine 3-dehydrogenase
LPERLAVGVVGTGRMGAFHVAAWRRSSRARLVAVADPDPAARARALSGASGVAGYDDWADLIERGDLDAVSVACPSRLHAEVVLAALDAGLHVMVEKPIATALPDALRMRSASRASGRKLMVGHVERFNPVVAVLRARLQQGALGRVFRAHATRVGPLPTRVQDAGVAIDLATHDLDVVQHVLDGQVTEIYADGGRFAHEREEDLLACLARLDSPLGEVLGLLDVNWLTPERRRELTFIGEGGMLRADYFAQEIVFVPATSAAARAPISLSGSDGTAERISLERIEPLPAELDAFAECVLEDLPEPVSAHDGVRALAAALAVRESAAERRAVRLLDIPAPPTLQVVA